MLKTLQALFGTAIRLDQSVGPPWAVDLWNPTSAQWEALGIIGGQGPAGPAGAQGPAGPQGPAGRRAISGLLSLLPRHSGILDGAYLARMDGLAVLTTASDPIATQPLRVVTIEEHILTSAGDVIAV